jgi:hypothetical protein
VLRYPQVTLQGNLSRIIDSEVSQRAICRDQSFGLPTLEHQYALAYYTGMIEHQVARYQQTIRAMYTQYRSEHAHPQ